MSDSKTTTMAAARFDGIGMNRLLLMIGEDLRRTGSTLESINVSDTGSDGGGCVVIGTRHDVMRVIGIVADNGEDGLAHLSIYKAADDPLDDFNYVGSRHHY